LRTSASTGWPTAAAMTCALLLAVSGCGGSSPAPTQPTTPAAPTPTPGSVTEVRVGTAGNAATVVAPGVTLQLFAQAVNSDGTVIDVTNVALCVRQSHGYHDAEHLPLESAQRCLVAAA